MPELGSAVFRIYTDAKDFHKDLDKAEAHANKMASGVGDSLKSVDKDARRAGSGIQSFSADLDDARASSRGLNDEVKRTTSSTKDANGWIARITNTVRNWRVDIDKTSKSHDGLVTRMLKLNIVTKFLGNTMKILKWPALITGAGLAAGALAQLTAGAYALVSAMGPLSGAVIAMPAALGTLVQSMITVKLAMSGVGNAFKDWGKELKKATPEATAFAKNLQQYTPMIRSLQRAAQRGLFHGITAGVREASANLPAFRQGLEETGSALGHVAHHLGMVFGGRAFGSMIPKIMGTNNRVLKILGDALGHLALSAGRVAVAARPLVVWMAQGIDKFAKWADGATKAGLETGKMASFFHQTQVALKRWGSIIGNVVTGLYNIGKIAAPAGRDLARSLDIASGHFRAWTESAKGKNQIKHYFDQIVPSVEAAGRLVRTITRAFFRLGNDANIAPLIDEIRTKFIPVLEDLLHSTSQAMGPAFIELLTNVGRVMAVFIGQSGPLLNFVKILGSLAGVIADILQDNSGLQSMAVTLVGFAGVAKAISFVGAITGIKKLIALAGTAKLAFTGVAAAETEASAAAAPGGKAAGSVFAARAQVAAMAGFAGWEIGSWLRNHVPAIKSAGDFMGKTFASVFGVGANEAADKASEKLLQSTERAAAGFKRAKDPVDKFKHSLELHKLAAEASIQSLVRQEAALIKDGARMDGTNKKSENLRHVIELLKQKTDEGNNAAKAMAGGIDKLGINFKNLGGTVKETSSYISAATNQVLAGLGAKTIKFSLQRAAALEGYGGTSSHAIGGWIGQPGRAGRDKRIIAVGDGEAVVNRHQQAYVNAGLAAVGMPGGMNELFQRVRTKHFMARGGMTNRVSANVTGPPGPMLNIGRGVAHKESNAANAKIARVQAALARSMGGSSTKGLIPQVLRALAWARSHGWSGVVSSGFRSRAEQAILYARYLAGGNLAAKPGQSNHERGRAVDVTDIEGFKRAMSSAPANARLRWFGPGDPVHFSVDGHARGGFVGAARGYLTKRPKGWSTKKWQAYQKANPRVQLPAKPPAFMPTQLQGMTTAAGFAFDPSSPKSADAYMTALQLQQGDTTSALNKLLPKVTRPYKDPAVRKLKRRKGETKGHLRTRQLALKRTKQTAERQHYSDRVAQAGDLVSQIQSIGDSIKQTQEATALAPLNALRTGAAGSGALGLDVIGQQQAEAQLTQTLDDDVAAQQNLVEQRKKEYDAAKATGLASVISEAATNYHDAIDGLKSLQDAQTEAAQQARLGSISRAAAEARLTETMTDDIDAAQKLKDERQREYEEAKKTGVDDKIAEAANNYADAIANLEQIQQAAKNSIENLQTLLDREHQQRLTAEEAARLANGFISTMRASGDINYGYNGPPIQIYTLHPADPKTLDAIGQAATAGLSLQGSVTSPRYPTGV